MILANTSRLLLRGLLIAYLASLSFSNALKAAPLVLVWPTPNTAFQEGRPAADYLQPTQSGKPESGGYGCVRNNGARFHEGVDLKAVRRDSKGEPIDPVFAIMDGKVAYINQRPGKSSSGRYLVIEHTGQPLALYSLYAHLRRIQPNLKTGSSVKAGDALGTMGRSAIYSIPKSRAHLHLEIGLQLSDTFQKWYDLKDFENPNEHGNMNGLNLIGFDSLAFFSMFKNKQRIDIGEYIKKQPVAFTLRVLTRKTPDFVRRYPSLLEGTYSDDSLAAGWDVDFTAFGFPIKWKPVLMEDLLEPWNENRVILLHWQTGLLNPVSCRDTISPDGSMGANLRQILELLFEFRPR